VLNVLVAKRINSTIKMKEGRDQWLPLLDQASDNNVAEIMDAEDPLFILTLPVLPENQKEWYTLQRLYGVFCLYV
jgi:hypothetical protein